MLPHSLPLPSSRKARPQGLSLSISLLMRLVICLTLFLGLPLGCARPKPPEKNLADSLPLTGEGAAKYIADGEWWLLRNDPGLNAVIDKVLKDNLELKRGLLTVQKAQIQAELSERNLFPTLSGGVSASARKDFERGESSRGYGGNLGLSYEPDIWGEISGAASAARLESLAAEEDLLSLRLSLISEATDAYYNLAYLNDAKKENQKNLDNLLTLEEKVLLKYESGSAPPAEPLQAALSVLNARDNILNSDDEIHRAKALLKNLMNLKPSDPLGAPELPDLENITLKDSASLPPDLSVPYSILANRPELKAAELRLFKAFKTADVASSAWFPSISLSSGVSVSSETIGTLFESPQGSLGLSVSLPFLDWTRVKGNIKISELDYESARLSFEEALTTALNELSTLYQGYVTKLTLLERLKIKRDYNGRISEYYRERYEAGATELSDWLGAVNSANSSNLSVLSGTYQLLMAENEIYKALAGRYEKEDEEGEPEGDRLEE